MVHILIWAIMFLIWYLYRTYKASVEEKNIAPTKVLRLMIIKRRKL